GVRCEIVSLYRLLERLLMFVLDYVLCRDIVEDYTVVGLSVDNVYLCGQEPAYAFYTVFFVTYIRITEEHRSYFHLYHLSTSLSFYNTSIFPVHTIELKLSLVHQSYNQ